MKNSIKVLAALILINFSVTMKAQCTIPYKIVNNVCDVDILVTVFDSNCSVLSGPTAINIPAGNLYAVTTAGAWEVEILVINVGGPSCPANQFNGPVRTSCGSTCPPQPSSSPLSGGTCCPVRNIIATCTGATIN